MTAGNRSIRARRSYRDIWAKALESVKPPGASLSSVVVHVRTNRKHARQYLDVLIDHGFIRIVDNTKGRLIYVPTERGLRWLTAYKAMRKEEEEMAF